FFSSRRRHTRSTRDWSSDVCSSDLRKYARGANLAELAGVLSLELCGIGDTLAVWDAVDQTPFLGRVRAAFDGIGLRRDESYHVRSEERRVGKEERARGGTCAEQKEA